MEPTATPVGLAFEPGDFELLVKVLKAYRPDTSEEEATVYALIDLFQEQIDVTQ